MLNSKKSEKSRGFSLIESLVFLFIFSITVVTFFTIIAGGMANMNEVKYRAGAVELAKEEMEKIRNLEYNKIEDAAISKTEVISSGRLYYVSDIVDYMDDALDGVGAGDSKPTDYIRVSVKVEWELENPKKAIELVSTFAPPGVEEIYEGGIISLHVLNNENKGIDGVSVKIYDLISGTSETVTAVDGVANFYNKIAGTYRYRIEVTKNGYFPIQTYLPTSSFYPTDEHGSVVEGQINPKTINTDQVSSFNLITQNPQGDKISDISFELKGGKKKGELIPIFSPYNPEKAIYEYDNTGLSTGISGEKNFSEMSSGSYFFTFKNPTSDYEFIKIKNSFGEKNRFLLLAGSSQDVEVVLADKSANSLLVTVLDNAVPSGEPDAPIFHALVKLKNETLGYEETDETDEYGQVYFPKAGTLTADNGYSLEVSATNFQDDSSSNINISDLVKKEVKLNPL